METHATTGRCATARRRVTESHRCRPYPSNPYAVRDRLILDAVAAREDDRANAALGRGNLPHFERRIRAARWGRYGQFARLTDTDRRLRHMADGAGLVEMKLQSLAAAR